MNEISSRSHIRRMEVLTDSNTRVMNAFTQTQAFLVVRVNRILRWIDQQHDDEYDIQDVIPSIVVIFPLSFQYMFSDMNLQRLGVDQLLNNNNNRIPQDFWEEDFNGIISSGIKRLADLATETKLRKIALRVTVDVVRTEPYDEELFLQYISILRSLTQLDPSTFADDQSDYKVMPASRDSIDALMTITFKISVLACNGTADEEMVDVLCLICLNEYCDGEKIKKMPCSHWFHKGCIDRWLEKRHTCPLCRFQMPVA